MKKRLPHILTGLMYLIPFGIFGFIGYRYHTLQEEAVRVRDRADRALKLVNVTIQTLEQCEASKLFCQAELERLDDCGARCGDCP